MKPGLYHQNSNRHIFLTDDSVVTIYPPPPPVTLCICFTSGKQYLGESKGFGQIKQVMKALCLDHLLWNPVTQILITLSHCALLSPWEERFYLLFQTDLKAGTAYGKLTNGPSLEPDKHCLPQS